MENPSQTNDAPWPWRHRFAELGEAFYTRLAPQPLPQPHWVARNPALAAAIGLPEGWLDSDEALQALSGNAVLPGAQTLASVYSGHQFGVWAGQLGDGRALLMGEVVGPDGGQELQLKGAGRTPYSRMGDGRAVLRSSIREYLCSEAMAGLGIPTTRALAITGSPFLVRRERAETTAVVTRVAPSFIRFGHFEHFSARDQLEPLRRLADHVITEHYPECLDAGPNERYAKLLQAVSERTAALMAQWQAVGFCHGVMNTDNMSMLGLTLDYGPFQFIDGFDPSHVCNHSDEQGRYAYHQQPGVAFWNLHCLAQALLPLISPGGADTAPALEALDSYRSVFPERLHALMAAKLGLAPGSGDEREQVQALIRSVQDLLASERTDYTIFWRRLSEYRAQESPQTLARLRELFIDSAAFDAWKLQYSEHISQYGRHHQADLMLKVNPKVVLRNHLGEIAIRAAEQGNFEEIERLRSVLSAPFDEHPDHASYADFPPDWAGGISISCSS